MMKKMSYIIILIGIGIFLYPSLNNLYSWYEQQRLITQWEEELTFVDQNEGSHEAELGDSYSNLNRLFTENAVEENEVVEEEPELEPLPNSNSLRAIGLIKIDKINLTLPIVDGTSENDLNNAAGRLEGTAKLGEIGNAAIAAHRGYSRGRLFNRLDEMEIGDKIKIQTKDSRLEYEVYQVLIVEPTDLSVLDNKEDQSIITLITCDPLYDATHRLIVHAKKV